MTLNLRKSIIEQFWQHKDPRMARILMWMESMEDWMLDDNEEFNKALIDLVPKIENATRSALLGQSEPLLEVMAYMSSARALRMIEWFDEHFPRGMSIDFLEYAQQNPENTAAQLLVDRLRALQSLSLLGRVFSPTRVRIITELLRRYPE